MQKAQTWIIAIVVLIVGVGATYYNLQMETDELAKQISTLEARLDQADEAAKNAEARASELVVEMSSLNAEIDEKSKLVADQAARIKELEAASQ